jgi:hypothetical protein
MRDNPAALVSLAVVAVLILAFFVYANFHDGDQR